MFNMLMVATEKKLKLIEKKVGIVVALEDTKMLTLKIEDLDDDTRVIVHAICFEMLKWQKEELEAKKATTEKEVTEKEAAKTAEKDAEAATADRVWRLGLLVQQGGFFLWIDGRLVIAISKPLLDLGTMSVGLLGMARSFQKELDQIAEKADTSTPAGLSFVLTETTLALLRHPDCCISAYSTVDVKRSMDDGEKRFNQLSIEERGKFDEETLVNVNSIKRQKAGTQRSSGFSNEYIVITILVAAEGVYKLPTINSSSDLKTALQMLGGVPSSKIMAVEVLWTPQNENDTLSERELLEDYPLLRPL
ncbi:unnamed protein product [Triticum turgidum subsp. durum]|uniref:Uncharacterized protein n=1 Tax=Triticum turgidum subsp. durum TaxID=4567 RepID=A0A9R0SIL4_TRITD|nr:unnamed protein product [Triticum turgidum subsp. durum]